MGALVGAGCGRVELYRLERREVKAALAPVWRHRACMWRPLSVRINLMKVSSTRYSSFCAAQRRPPRGRSRPQAAEVAPRFAARDSGLAPPAQRRESF